MSDYKFFDQVNKAFEKSAEFSDHDEGLLVQIKNCNNVYHITFPLERDDGSALYDSPVICEYLDSFEGAPLLIPASGEARWSVLRAQALADGIMDLAAATVMERARPENEQSPGSMSRWRSSRAVLCAECASPRAASISRTVSRCSSRRNWP